MVEEIREAIYFPILWAVHLYLESRNDEVAYAMFQGPNFLQHPVVSVFCQPPPKQQKYQNFHYKKAVREWLR